MRNLNFKKGVASGTTASVVVITISFCVSFVLLVLYVVHFGRSDFSSDDTALSLQAESIWRQGTLFPSGWIGNNGDLMIPSGVLMLAPLLNWFQNTYELHAVVGICSVLLLLGTFSIFLLKSKLPPIVVLIAATVLLSGFSRISVIMLYLQTTYVWWPAAFFLGATLIWRERESRSNGFVHSKLRIVALAILVFLIAIANPGRALIMVVFPLYVFDRVLASCLNHSQTVAGRRLVSHLGIRDPLVFMGLGAGFTLAALAYYAMFRAGVVQTIHNSSSLRWEGWSGVMSHAKIFFSGWFDYLGGVREINAPKSVLENVLAPLRLVFAIWLTWVGIAEALRVGNPDEPLRQALAAAFLAALFPILFLYLSYSPLAINFSTIRYFTVPIVMLLAMAAFRVARASGRLRQIANPLSIAFSVFMILVCAVRFVPAMSQPGLSFFALRDSHAFHLKRLLENENLTWGYASWWNAGVVTILSSEKIRINPIDFSGTDIVAFPNLTQQLYFNPQAYVGETFLLLEAGEATPERVSTFRTTLGQPSRIIESEGILVYVFPENIASHICNTGDAIDLPLSEQEHQAFVSNAAFNPIENGKDFESIAVTVRNNGTKTLGAVGINPVSIGIQLVDQSGSAIAPDWVHFPLTCAIRPGESRVYLIKIPAMPRESRVAKIGLVQEGVAWFEHWGIKPLSLSIAAQRKVGDSLQYSE